MMAAGAAVLLVLMGCGHCIVVSAFKVLHPQLGRHRGVPAISSTTTGYHSGRRHHAANLSSLFASSSPSSSPSSLSNDEIRRYSRHLVLGEVGMQGQLALKNARVLVIGAGGLGSPCLLYLAAAGVGGIGIVDADTVDESNLQRQIIHGCDTIGVSKCASAAQRIRDVNPHVVVRLYEEEFTSQTAERIVAQGFADSEPWDLVVDGSDNFPTKYLIK